MDNSSSTGIIFGQEKRFEFEPRYFLETAERAMKGDIVRGLVELITNADDSYGEIELNHLKTSGEIIISVERKRKNSTIITITDKAEGMELEEMVSKLSRVGGITSKFLEAKGSKTRGLMGRGSKECVVFGNLTFKSIKNNVYSELQLKKPANFVAIDNRPATEFDRVRLNIPRGNGTIVILEIDPQFKIPSHQFLVENLPKYYSLRDISNSSQRKLELFDLGGAKERKDPLVYTSRQGIMVLDELITVPGYPKAEAHITILKSPERIKVETNSPYWEGGVLIQSNYAIHGVTGFSRDIENNPYFERYFGRIKCPYIDELAIEYELQERQKIAHSSNNPSRIIDPLRSEGLTSDHPFTKTLYSEAIRRIKILLKKDEDEITNKTREIENKKTTGRLRKLASEVSKFIKEQTEILDEPDDDNYLDSYNIPSGGMMIVPGGSRIPVGEVRKFYVYIKPNSDQTERQVAVSTESKAVLLNSDVEGLLDRGDGILYTYFSVMGMDYADDIKIKVYWSGIEKYVSVAVVKKEEVHPYVKDFAFEKDGYKVRKGKHKEILILANWPGFVHGEVECNVSSDTEEFIDFTGKRTKLKYKIFDDGTEMGIGSLKVFGKKIGGPTIIKTSLQQKEIITKVFVLPTKELGHDIEIKVVDEDLGDQRALWNGNLLKIGGRHNSIRRYLGPAPDFSGQDHIHFRLLLAELIADNVARRILELNSQKNIREFEDMDVSSFYIKHRRYMNSFLEIAHQIQIPESEIEN